MGRGMGEALLSLIGAKSKKTHVHMKDQAAAPSGGMENSWFLKNLLLHREGC